MLGNKLFIVFLILFCSFSVILFPLSDTIDSLQSISSNKPNEHKIESPERFFNENFWYDAIKIAFGTALGVLSGFFINKITHRQNTKSDNISEFKKKAFILFTEILTEIQSSELQVGRIIDKYLPETDISINLVIQKVRKDEKVKLRNAYAKYSNPNNTKNKYTHNWITPYNMIHSNFKKTKHYKQGSINKGKDFAIHNIQKVIDLLK